MLKILFLIIFIFSTLISYSQTCQWASKIEGKGPVGVTDIKIDSKGNTYYSGGYSPTKPQDTVNFNNGIFILADATLIGFIAKYDSLGNCLWVQKISSGEDEPNVQSVSSIVIDSSDNLYIVGYFSANKLIFNNKDTLINSNINTNYYGVEDGFIAKFNSDGLCQWAKKIGGLMEDAIIDCSMYYNKYLYMLGNSSSTKIDFGDSISIIDKDSLKSSNFIAKYSLDGKCIWAKLFKADEIHDVVDHIAVDSSSNIYISNTFTDSTFALDSNNILINSSIGLREIFLTKLDSNGNIKWARTITGDSTDKIMSIVISGENIFITGWYLSTTLDFGNGQKLYNNAYSDAFIAKFNSYGVCEWSLGLGNTNGEGICGVSTDSNENLYICGGFSSNRLDLSNSIFLNNVGDWDSFVMKINKYGIIQWGEQIAGTKYDMIYPIQVSNNSVYIAGISESSLLSFNNSHYLDELFPDQGSYMGFISKYNDNTLSINDESEKENHFNAFFDNNKQLNLSYYLEQYANYSINIYNYLGQLINVCSSGYKDSGAYFDKIEIDNLISGMYFLVFSSGDKIETQKIIINN